MALLQGDILSTEYDELIPQLTDLSKRPLTYLDRPRIRVDDILFFARQSKADAVIIDYLGLMDHRAGRSIYEKVSATSNELKRAARTLKVPVLCLAQLNREIEGRKGPPRLSDLRDSGAIEQDADGVFLLHKLDRGESTDSKLSPLDLIVAKHRHGGTGTVRFSWALRNGRIVQEVGG
jgi:replicative DNA helicase